MKEFKTYKGLIKYLKTKLNSEGVLLQNIIIKDNGAYYTNMDNYYLIEGGTKVNIEKLIDGDSIEIEKCFFFNIFKDINLIKDNLLKIVGNVEDYDIYGKYVAYSYPLDPFFTIKVYDCSEKIVQSLVGISIILKTLINTHYLELRGRIK